MQICLGHFFLTEDVEMRMSRVMIASAIGMMASQVSPAVEATPLLGGSVSPFMFETKAVGNKPNKVSQKKRRLNARRKGRK